MKNSYTGFIVLVLILVLVTPALAVGNSGAGQISPAKSSAVPVATSVTNTNQVQTQNQGEETELKVSTKEQENELKSPSPRSETAEGKMSEVAKNVENILTTQGAMGGIGEEVRTIAQEQKMVQEELQLELNKLDSRKGIAKLLVGPDYKAIKNLREQMEQNQLRIEALQQLQLQLEDKGDATQVMEMIQALTEQNVTLQERLELESQTKSMLGWLFKFFAK